LRRHRDRHEAMAVALRRSFPAVLASAATVTAGLLCLLAALLPSTRGLGPVGAVGVAAALVAMTTLLPALLVLCGRWLFWPFVPRYAPSAVGHDVAADHGLWGRGARRVGRRPPPSCALARGARGRPGWRPPAPADLDRQRRRAARPDDRHRQPEHRPARR